MVRTKPHFSQKLLRGEKLADDRGGRLNLPRTQRQLTVVSRSPGVQLQPADKNPQISDNELDSKTIVENEVPWMFLGFHFARLLNRPGKGDDLEIMLF